MDADAPLCVRLCRITVCNFLDSRRGKWIDYHELIKDAKKSIDAPRYITDKIRFEHISKVLEELSMNWDIETAYLPVPNDFSNPNRSHVLHYRLK